MLSLTIRLPLEGDPAHEAVHDAIHEIVDALSPENRGRLQSLATALIRGRRTTRESKAAHSCHCVCVNAQADVLFIRIGKRGGWKKIWTFGRLGAR